jgi:polar amino acid transport system substrate-binding protein
MRMNWKAALVLGLLVSACAGVQTAPTQEEKLALAPTGKLRGAFFANQPAHATKDPVSGEPKGIAIDLGKELARRLGVPFEPVTYPTPSALAGSIASGQWDIIFTGIIPGRAKELNISAPYVQIEIGYLVAKGGSISDISDVDKPGARIGVLRSGATDVLLTHSLKAATLVRTPTIAAAVDMVRSGKADAVAAVKTVLYPITDRVPGLQVLEGRIAAEDIGIGVPKERAAGASYVRKVVDELKAAGFVKAAVERAGVRGVVAVP